MRILEQKLPIRWAAVCGWCAVFSIISQVVAATVAPVANPPMLVDFIEYWASARLLLTGQNPYSLPQLLSLQQTVGWTATFPHIMWNPPWTLTFLIPFGWFNFSTARLLWLGLLSVITLFCARHLWTLYGGPKSRYRIAWIMTFTFAPTIFALLLQQIATLTLLGVVGFLHFEKQKWHKMAGASLVLVALKPHLYFIFWLVLFLWIIDRRRWDVFFGFAIGILLTSTVPTAFNHRLFYEFVQLYFTAPFPTPFDQETPTLARALRHLVNIDNPLPQFLPACIGILWSGWHWKKYKNEWNWIQQVPFLLLVSVTTNFFAWSADQVILLPALLQGIRWSRDAGFRATAILPVTLYIITELAILLVKVFTPYDFWYFWLSLVWCFIYLSLRQTALITDAIDKSTLTSQESVPGKSNPIRTAD